MKNIKSILLAVFALFAAADGFAGHWNEDREIAAAAQQELHECFAEQGGGSWEAHGECWEKFGRKMSETHGGFWREAWREGWGWFAATIFFLVIVIVAAPFLIITLAIAGWTRRKETPAPDALGILAERFARGEIDENEYRARKNALKENEHSAK